MLADIHKALNIKDGMDATYIASAIDTGNLWSLGPSWFARFQPDPEKKVVDETMNYLDMWSIIEAHYARLDAEGKDKVKAANCGHEPGFPGFDQQNEPHSWVAHRLIDQTVQFPQFKKRLRNSHWPIIQVYSAMYAVFDPIRKTLAGRTLTSDEMIEILTAR